MTAWLYVFFISCITGDMGCYRRERSLQFWFYSISWFKKKGYSENMVRVEMSFLNSELWKGKYFDVCYPLFAYVPVPLDFLKLWNKWEAKANFYEGKCFWAVVWPRLGCSSVGSLAALCPAKHVRVVPPNGFVYAVVLRKPWAVYCSSLSVRGFLAPLMI